MENPEEDMKPTIDAIEAVKTQAAINLGRYQEETRRWHNKKVRPREIKEGDLVLHRIPKNKLKGKMNNKWEGPSWSLRRQDSKLADFTLSMGSKTRTHGTKTCSSVIMFSFSHFCNKL